MPETKFEVDRANLEVRITRVFKATPERLWQAHTDPDQIAKWWDKTVIDKFELKVGGAWRFVSNGDDGQEHAFKGVFKELDEPKKIVRTFEYEPWAGHVMVESVIFEPTADGLTKQITVSKYDNLDDLEGMVNSGMEGGATTGLERLAKLVEQS
jgi:uncharacterized protein YndB with AHSA1/START domain